ncbi:MAG: hypothetical protein HYX97_00895 [Chloroflexi bacterium]|nr:hypothetical protein [Chloroflexota bacterium]
MTIAVQERWILAEDTPWREGSTPGLRGQNRYKPCAVSTKPGEPTVYIINFSPGTHLDAHYHMVRQFQLVVEGSCTVANHKARPFLVHYTDAKRAYGPIVTKNEGLVFITLRVAPTGIVYMWQPEGKQASLAGREIIVADADVPAAAVNSGQRKVLIDPQQHGILTEEAQLRPGATFPDEPAIADEFLVVLDGDCIVAGKQRGKWDVRHRPPGAPADLITAGPHGAAFARVRFAA